MATRFLQLPPRSQDVLREFFSQDLECVDLLETKSLNTLHELSFFWANVLKYIDLGYILQKACAHGDVFSADKNNNDMASQIEELKFVHVNLTRHLHATVNYLLTLPFPENDNHLWASVKTLLEQKEPRLPRHENITDDIVSVLLWHARTKYKTDVYKMSLRELQSEFGDEAFPNWLFGFRGFGREDERKFEKADFDGVLLSDVTECCCYLDDWIQNKLYFSVEEKDYMIRFQQVFLYADSFRFVIQSKVNSLLLHLDILNYCNEDACANLTPDPDQFCLACLGAEPCL